MSSTPRLHARLFAPLCFGLLVCGCTGTEVGNPGNADVRIQFTALDPAPNALIIEGAEIAEAWIVIGEVELRPRESCDDAEPNDDDEVTELEVRGPFAIELVSREELPDAPRLMPRGGAFCRLELEVDPLDPERAPLGVPDALLDHSILIRGSRTDGVPFEIALRSELEVRLEAASPTGFELTGGSPLVVGFDVAAWLAELDLAALEPSPDGTVRIDEENNADLGERLTAAIDEGAELHRDRDEDGEVDEDDDELD